MVPRKQQGSKVNCMNIYTYWTWGLEVWEHRLTLIVFHYHHKDFWLGTSYNIHTNNTMKHYSISLFHIYKVLFLSFFHTYLQVYFNIYKTNIKWTFNNTRFHGNNYLSKCTISWIDHLVENFFFQIWGMWDVNSKWPKLRGHISYSGIFYFCQYLHIRAGILSFGGDVFRL